MYLFNLTTKLRCNSFLWVASKTCSLICIFAEPAKKKFKVFNNFNY